MLYIEEFTAYLLAERRYSPHTARAYGDDVRQFADFLRSVRDGVAAGEAEAWGVAGSATIAPEALIGAPGAATTSPVATVGSAIAKSGANVVKAAAETIIAGQAAGGPAPIDPRLVTTDDLREWIMHLSGKEKLSASSINRKISSAKAFFRYLRGHGITDTDPFAKIMSMKTPRRLPSFVEESRMERVVEMLLDQSDDFIQERDRLMVLMFYATGVRLAELLGITKDDFSSDHNLLKVRGKGDKERIIPVAPLLKAKILHYLETIRERNICTDDKFSLFLTVEGNPVSRSEVYSVVRRTLKDAGVQGKSSPHVLRHTFATHLLDGQADIRSIQELLGHSSLAATQVYTHNTIEQLKKAYTKAHPRAKSIKTKK